MKKLILIIILGLICVYSFAFEEINPAFEMSGKYLRFSSFNERSFNEFDDGFNRIAFSVAKPKFYKNWSLSTDFKFFGDDIYQKFNWNISPAYTFYDKYVIAASFGFINKSIGASDLIFGEEESIESESVTKASVGLSMHADIWKNISFKMNTMYLNQPKLSFLGSDEKEDVYLMTGLDWKINKLYSVGLSYKNEDRQDYFKLNFEARFPYPELKHRISASSEKVTYNPVFSFFNYWQVGLGYDIYYDSNLGNQNLELDIIYEYPGSETPVIKVSELNNDTEEQNLSFEVTGASRYRNINVKLNDEEVFLKQYLWDDDCKKFDIPIKLTATNNQIEISAVSVNGETCSEIIDIDLSSLAIVSEPEPVIQDTVETEEIVASVIEDSVEVVKVKPEVIHQEPVITDIVIISIPKSYRKNGNVPYLYTVKKGDNLWNMAKKKNVFGNPFKWVQLDLKNGLVIKNPDLIYPGQIIYIENNSVYDDFVEKTVKKGDNIWDLSHEMVKDIKDRDILIMANKETMKRPDIIQPGQKISFKLFIVK